jgi:hypothetical protein
MSLSKYRLWKGHKIRGKGWEEIIVTFLDMACLVTYLVFDLESPIIDITCEWGIEKFDSTQNIWVDAFFSNDIRALFEEMLGINKRMKENFTTKLLAIVEEMNRR